MGSRVGGTARENTLVHMAGKEETHREREGSRQRQDEGVREREKQAETQTRYETEGQGWQGEGDRERREGQRDRRRLRERAASGKTPMATQGRARRQAGQVSQAGDSAPGRAVLEAQLQGWSLMSLDLIRSLLGQEDSGWR